MTSSLRSTFALLTLAASLLASIPARAVTLALETFNQDPTGSSISGLGGGTGWGGNWFASNSANGYLFTTRNSSSTGYQALAYPGYTSSTVPAASGGNYENLASGFGGDQATYVQRPLDTSATGMFGVTGLATSGVIGANNSTVWGSFLYSNDTSGNTGNTQLSFGLLGAGTFTFNLTQPAASNLVVFRVNYGSNYLTNDTVTVFINPTLGGTFDGSSGGTTSSVGNYSFTTFRVTTAYSGGSGSQSSFDDVRFGSTVADVVPAPEPSTYAMVGLGAIAVWVYRRQFVGA